MRRPTGVVRPSFRGGCRVLWRGVGAIVALAGGPGCSDEEPLGVGDGAVEASTDASDAHPTSDASSNDAAALEVAGAPDAGGDASAGAEGGQPDQGAADAGSAVDRPQGPDAALPAIGTYVSVERGDDGNPGTKERPLLSIARGIEHGRLLMAAGGGPQTVYFAGGHYYEKLVLVEGVSLLGGHDCSAKACTWSQDPRAFGSEVHAVDTQGLLAPSDVTGATKVEGAVFFGWDSEPAEGPGSAAITLAGGTPTIRGNTISGRKTSVGPGRSVGIRVLAAAATPGTPGAIIDGNTINGGPSLRQSVGVVLEAGSGAEPGAAVVVTLVNNTIRANDAPSSVGILATASAAGAVIKGNTILAGGSPGDSWGAVLASPLTFTGNRINLDAAAGSCEQANTWCGGIRVSTAAATLTNNIVRGPKGPRSAGVLLEVAGAGAPTRVVNANTFDGGGDPGAVDGVSAAAVLRFAPCTTCGATTLFTGRLRNNILLGGSNPHRYGVLEEVANTGAVHAEALDHNDFFFAPLAGRKDTIYLLARGGGGEVTFGDLPSVPVASGVPLQNLNADPALDGTMHLGPGSPCKDKGTDVEAPPVDMDGDPRPRGSVDIGHDEAP